VGRKVLFERDCSRIIQQQLSSANINIGLPNFNPQQGHIMRINSPSVPQLCIDLGENNSTVTWARGSETDRPGRDSDDSNAGCTLDGHYTNGTQTRLLTKTSKIYKWYVFSQFIAPTCFGHFWRSSGCAVTEYSCSVVNPWGHRPVKAAIFLWSALNKQQSGI
jgi:hypothetical protein